MGFANGGLKWVQKWVKRAFLVQKWVKSGFLVQKWVNVGQNPLSYEILQFLQSRKFQESRDFGNKTMQCHIGMRWRIAQRLVISRCKFLCVLLLALES